MCRRELLLGRVYCRVGVCGCLWAHKLRVCICHRCLPAGACLCGRAAPPQRGLCWASDSIWILDDLLACSVFSCSAQLTALVGGVGTGVSLVAGIFTRASTCILCISVYISIWVYTCIYNVKCERCLLITESPKTPGHFRYLIWVFCYIPYTGLAVFTYAISRVPVYTAVSIPCKFVFSTLKSRSCFQNSFSFDVRKKTYLFKHSPCYTVSNIYPPSHKCHMTTLF